MLGFFEPADEGRRVADKPQRAFLLSGIARPERFAADVRASGVEVLGHKAFPDHHPFSPPELAAVIVDSQRAGADAIVTTAKDCVRMPAPASGARVLTFEIAAQIDDEDALRERLRQVTGRLR